MNIEAAVAARLLAAQQFAKAVFNAAVGGDDLEQTSRPSASTMTSTQPPRLFATSQGDSFGVVDDLQFGLAIVASRKRPFLPRKNKSP